MADRRWIVVFAVLGLGMGTGCERDDSSLDESSVEDGAEAVEAVREAPPEEEASEETATEKESAEKGAPRLDVVGPLEDIPERLRSQLSEPRSTTHRDGLVSLEVWPPDDIRKQLEEDQRLPIPYEPEEWPEEYRNFTAVEALSPEGPVLVEWEEIGTGSRAEGMELHFMLLSEPSEAVARAPGRTFIAAPGVMPPDARMKRAEVEPVEEELAAELWERFLERIEDHHDRLEGMGFETDHPRRPSPREQLEESIRAVEEGEQSLDSYVRGYEGPFGGPYTRLVTVSRDLWGLCVSTGYLVDDSGEEIKEVEWAVSLVRCFQPSALGDLEGDGYWGVVYAHGVEPHPFRIKWMEFDERGEPETETLDFIASH